jgi:hypothetical protein
MNGRLIRVKNGYPHEAVTEEDIMDNRSMSPATELVNFR